MQNPDETPPNVHGNAGRGGPRERAIGSRELRSVEKDLTTIQTEQVDVASLTWLLVWSEKTKFGDLKNNYDQKNLGYTTIKHATLNHATLKHEHLNTGQINTRTYNHTTIKHKDT